MTRRRWQFEGFGSARSADGTPQRDGQHLHARPRRGAGIFALECAVDELAERLGMDPIELRLLNEPEKDPTSGLRFSCRDVERMFRDGPEEL